MVFRKTKDKSAPQEPVGGDQDFWSRILWLSLRITTPKTSEFGRKSLRMHYNERFTALARVSNLLIPIKA